MNKRYIIIFFKIGISLFALLFIYLKLQSTEDLQGKLHNLALKWDSGDSGLLLSLLLFLMMANWGMEALKWKILLKPVVNVNYLTSLRAILSGVTVTLFTPNRIGEFAGRIFHLEKGVRIKGALASVAGSMNQLLVTLVIGSIALVITLSRQSEESYYTGIILYFLAVCAIVFLVWLYFKLPGLPGWIQHLKWIKKYNRFLEFFTRYDTSILARVSVLSLARYMIFTSQFVIILMFFGLELDIMEMVRLVALTYLVTTLLPGFALAELALRGSVAVFFFEDSDPAIVLASSLSLWLMNIVLPGIVGACTAFYFKTFR